MGYGVIMQCQFLEIYVLFELIWNVFERIPVLMYSNVSLCLVVFDSMTTKHDHESIYSKTSFQTCFVDGEKVGSPCFYCLHVLIRKLNACSILTLCCNNNFFIACEWQGLFETPSRTSNCSYNDVFGHHVKRYILKTHSIMRNGGFKYIFIL